MNEQPGQENRNHAHEFGQLNHVARNQQKECGRDEQQATLEGIGKSNLSTQRVPPATEQQETQADAADEKRSQFDPIRGRPR